MVNKRDHSLSSQRANYLGRVTDMEHVTSNVMGSKEEVYGIPENRFDRIKEGVLVVVSKENDVGLKPLSEQVKGPEARENKSEEL